METNRMSYVVFYQGKRVLNLLETLSVRVVYVSQKQKYLVFYADRKQENSIRKKLKETKGFKHMSPSPLYNADLDFKEVDDK